MRRGEEAKKKKKNLILKDISQIGTPWAGECFSFSYSHLQVGRCQIISLRAKLRHFMDQEDEGREFSEVSHYV